MLTVTQNAQSTGNQQTRNYAYDAMSRLTSETNPESGTTNYVYDSLSGDANCGTVTSSGDLVKMGDAVGDTICNFYDALHRVTSQLFFGPYAANQQGNRYFVYDTGTVNGQTMQNGKARMIEAFTAGCSTCSKITDSGFSRTARGEISDVYQSTPHSGGYYHTWQTYWPHGVPSSLGSNLASLPGVSLYGVDGEGRINAVSASSGQNPVTATSYNVASQATSVTFGSGDSDAFQYDANTGRMTQYQFNVNGQSMTGNLTWNANGTLGTLGITDPFNSADTQTCNYSHDDLMRIASANCPGNQLQNPGFEGGSAGWSLGGAFSVVNNAANAQAGSWYLSASATGDNATFAAFNGSGWQAVSPGQVIYYGGWIKRVAGTGNLSYGCEVVDSNHNFVAWCPAAGTFDTSGGTNWQLYQQQITMPSNAAYIGFYAEIHCCVDTDNSATTGYFDSTFFAGALVAGQTFAYDPFGNINKSGSPNTFQPTYNSATNRFATIPGTTPSYDANGNVLSDGSHTYTWDEDGNSVTIDSVGLTFDALDRIVEENKSGTYYQFIYSPSGANLAITSGGGLTLARVPLPGGGIAEYDWSGALRYRHPDWLGSVRLISTQNRAMYSDTAYAPFGETYASSGTSDVQFTSVNADTAGGLYDFLAREYSTQGRWVSPDPAGLAAVDPSNPQSWNRYSYVLNNPLGATDPLGLECMWDDGTFDSWDDPQSGSAASCDALGGTWVMPITFMDGSQLPDWTDDPNSWAAQALLSYLTNGPDIQTTAWGSATGASGTSDALTPFATAVLGGVVNDILGPPAYRGCKAQVAQGFNNNWFIKNFSLGSLASDPAPFAKTTAEALAVKGGGSALAYGGGGALRSYGLKTMRGMGSFEPEWYIGKGMIKAGSALKGGALFGVKALGTVGTVATVGATAADFGNSQYASYQCRGYLN